MALLAQETFPGYIMWVIPVLIVAFYGLVVAAAASGARKSRGRRTPPAGRGRRSRAGRPSRDDDIWLASYLSEAHREQHHGRR